MGVTSYQPRSLKPGSFSSFPDPSHPIEDSPAAVLYFPLSLLNLWPGHSPILFLLSYPSLPLWCWSSVTSWHPPDSSTSWPLLVFFSLFRSLSFALNFWTNWCIPFLRVCKFCKNLCFSFSLHCWEAQVEFVTTLYNGMIVVAGGWENINHFLFVLIIDLSDACLWHC